MDNFAFSIDYNLLTDKDLEYLIDNLAKERERRNNVQREKDWNDFTNHLYQYIEKYGEITIRSDWEYSAIKTLGLDSDCSTFGEITL